MSMTGFFVPLGQRRTYVETADLVLDLSSRVERDIIARPCRRRGWLSERRRIR
jgi:hypothetical protein